MASTAGREIVKSEVRDSILTSMPIKNHKRYLVGNISSFKYACIKSLTDLENTQEIFIRAMRSLHAESGIPRKPEDEK